MIDCRWISVKALQAIACPLLNWPWDEHPSDSDHIERIMAFVHDGWNDPIGIDVGCLGFSPDWPIHDGNHRFYAAILRAEDLILAYVSGDLDTANELLQPTVPW